MKNPIFFFLIVVFIVLNIGDVITTHYILPGESNPLYLVTNNVNIIYAIKLIVIIGIVLYYTRNIYVSNFSYFMLLSIVVLGNMMLALALWGNINGMMHPEVVEIANQIPAKEKATIYFTIVGFMFILPFALNLLIFFLYDKSRKKIRVDKEYFKKLPWWRRL